MNRSAAKPAVNPDPAVVYICICNGVTDHEIRQAAQAGCRSTSELTMRTGAGANCGSCLDMAAALIEEVHGRRELSVPVLQAA